MLRDPTHNEPVKNFIANYTEAPMMHETENEISLQRRAELNTLTNQRLASAVDLQLQMKQAHFYVNGPSFIALRELFDPATSVATP